jgi:hypothetical protein
LAAGQVIDRDPLKDVMFGLRHLLPDLPEQEFLLRQMPVKIPSGLKCAMKHRTVQRFQNIGHGQS